MALQFQDSCNLNSTATLSQKYTSITNAAVTAGGRHNQGITSAAAGAWSLTPKAVSIATGAQGFAGVSFYPGVTPSGSGALFTFTEWQVSLYVTAADALAIYDSTGQKVVSSGGAFATATWQNIELLVDHAALTATAYVNGTSVCTTSVASNGTTLATVVIGDIGNVLGNAMILDDIYVADNSGTGFNGIRGTWQIYSALPVANGRTNTFTPLSGTNYSQVNQAPPPGNSAYVYATTAGPEDCYKFGPFVGGATIFAVQVVANMTKNTSGARTVALGVGNGATEVFDGGHSPTQGAFTDFIYPLSINPFTTLPWQVADLTTLQAAIKVTA